MRDTGQSTVPTSIVPGYQIEREVLRSRGSVVYRARRQRDDRPVIIKTLVDEFPTTAQAARLRHEYEIMNELDIEGVPRALDLVIHRDRPALVVDGSAGIPLRTQIPAEGFSLERFFAVAVPLAATVRRLHERGIVHQDVNPGNVLVDPRGSGVTLIDFGMATTHPSPERASLPAPSEREGTIAYMSPEQTGRMNRDVDHRTDLYSLGVTFYELLTGRLPFSSHDPLDLIHSHIAKVPSTPHDANPLIPPQLSALVMKLLAKSAEDRYQSARSVESDLTSAGDEWRRSGEIRELVPGRDDMGERFDIPQRLYGREAEVEALIQSFDRACHGDNELVLVSGYSGIGKTSLVLEMRRRLSGRPMHFTVGKFGQLARDVPYIGIVQALRGVVRHWLAEAEPRVREWGDRVRQALGADGHLVTDVIPELEGIIGPQPEPAPLDAVEAQTRFHRTIERLVGVMARPGHPLVLFLDDLQWADRATLSLLPPLLAGGMSRGLLLIGAYRDQEIPPAHPLHAALSDLRSRGIHVGRVALPPLGDDSLRGLIGEALRTSGDRVGEIAALVEDKTGGNPFFVIQFLRTLYQEGLLTLDRASWEWRADVPAIREANITDNVVELMSAKIQKLAPPTQRMLRLAACVGYQFDLATLATIVEIDATEVEADLREAIEGGLLRTESGAGELGLRLEPPADASRIQLRFLHDRVQQAAYELIPESDRCSVHLQIGRLLMARGRPDAPDELFRIVNHLNLGREGIADRAERLRLAELNLEAGRRAMVSGAYSSAGVYFDVGASLTEEEDWRECHPLAFGLHIERSEADHLCGRFAEAESGLRALLPRGLSALDGAEVRLREIAVFETMSRYADAIAAGVAGLEALGVELPATPSARAAALHEDLAEIDRLRGERPTKALLDLPRQSDPAIRKAMRLLMALWAPAYISGEESLRCLVVARMVRLSLEHGNCEESAFGYLHHGATVGYTLGDYARGFEFGQLGLALNERLTEPRLNAAIHHRFAMLVNPWTRPFESCIEHAKQAVRFGLDSGHLQVAGYARFVQSWYAMLLEPDLERFERSCLPSIEAFTQLKSPAFLEAQRLILNWGYALQGKTASPLELSSPDFDEAAFRAGVGRIGEFRGLYSTIRLELLDTFQQVEAAYRTAMDGGPAAELFASTIWPAIFSFRSVLALCAWLPAAPMDGRDATIARLAELEDRLSVWASNAPENFAHWHRLARAEIARVQGDVGAAVEHYEAAIALAERQTSPRHRALANELYGRFWLDRGQVRLATTLLREARFGFVQWGAAAKVADMDRRYRELLVTEERTPAVDAARFRVGGRSTGLDALALARAARVLSGEIELPRLLESLLRIVLQSAGARHACLILERYGQWKVEAQGATESESMEILQGLPLEECDSVPRSVVHFVARSGEDVMLGDGGVGSEFADDPYLARVRPLSILCAPISHQKRRVGVLYLENDLARDAFTRERVEMLQLLSAQAAVAIQNAELFAEVNRLHERARAENVYLHEEIKTRHGFEELVGRSLALRKVLQDIERVAEANTTVLVTGETGTGKELVARAIHRLSPRRDRPLVTINCGAISAGLVESELFGHERGAFTGAVARKIGRFEVADGGTLFLDEIGDLAPELQVKLLRVLEEGEIERVGNTKPIRVDVRVVAATHRDLAKEVRDGRFREDLFYRLNVFLIRTPSLRERPEDIPLLVRYFAVQHGLKLGKKIESFPKRVLDELVAYPWPGNVRELSNLIERSVLISTGPVLELRDWSPATSETPPAPDVRSLEDVERDHILLALNRTGWRVSGPRGAAQALGIKPTTLEARMARLGIRRIKQ